MTKTTRLQAALMLCLPLVLPVLLGACAGADKAKPVAVQSVIQAPGKASITVSDRDDAAGVVLDSAQELRVELSLSAWEVANNFDWSVAELKPGVLKVLGSRFERTTRDINPLESDGSTVWRVTPQAPGKVMLSFALRRPYSTGPAQRSVSFDVTVR